VDRVHDAALAHLSDAEQQQLIELLGAVRAGYSRDGQPPR
jgi:hypothetical protein